MSVSQRFESKVFKTDGCWFWTACVAKNGYGKFSYDGLRPGYAHRFSYQTFVGPIPDGHFVCHHCDNPRCVRPDHLFTGTQSDNLYDAGRKGRLSIQKHPLRGERNGRSKLTAKQVAEIRGRYVRGVGITLAKEYGVSNSTILRLVHGRSWAPRVSELRLIEEAA